MATYYLDYEGGNDANDGTTFANRWKTITNGATAARIAPGDTVRIMGSPDPTSLGINATWTNKNATVTLASALNVLITNCDTAWTASANVTCTANTSVYRTSTGSASMAVASGFTTGKIAYFDLGSNQDYSAYQGVTFWIHCTTGTIAASTIDLRLCSDTTGDTAVDTFTLPAISQSGQWVPVYLDKGSALGSSIRSISLYANSDPGTVTILLDNMSTVKAAGNNALNLKTPISKNTTGEGWWCLRQINGTALTLDITPSMTVSVTHLGYYGTTETVTTYIRKTIPTELVASSTTAVQEVQDSGTAGNLIAFSGGWNRTDMSTQTLQTYFDGQSGFGYGLYASSKSYFSFSRLHLIRYDIGIRPATNCTGWKIIGDCYLGNTYNECLRLEGADFTIDNVYIWSTQNSGIYDSGSGNYTIQSLVSKTGGMAIVVHGLTLFTSPSTGIAKITNLEIYNTNWHGLYASNTSNTPNRIVIDNLTVKDCGQTGVYLATIASWRIGLLTSTNNGASGVIVLTSYNAYIDRIVSQSNAGYGLRVDGFYGGTLTIGSLTTSGNSYGVSLSTIDGDVRILQSSLAETTKVAPGSYSYGSMGTVSFQNYNGTANDHRAWYGSGSGGGTILSESSVRHTASGIAWKISPIHATYNTADSPVVFKVGKVALAANITKTITLWFRRTNTGVTSKLVVRGWQLPGITSDQIATMSVAQDTWEQLSVTVTPTVAGVIEVETHTYGGSTYSVYVDDLGVS